jgi:mannose-6-phosphate isomerase-like protein (cupin superfamily)
VFGTLACHVPLFSRTPIEYLTVQVRAWFGAEVETKANSMIGASLSDEKLLAPEDLVFGGPTVGSEKRVKGQFLVNDRGATLAYEAFAAGSTVNWAFWHDEVHVITRGEAKVTYTLGPNHRKQVTKTFRKGDTYLIPNGARVRFEIGPDEPYLSCLCHHAAFRILQGRAS